MLLEIRWVLYVWCSTVKLKKYWYGLKLSESENGCKYNSLLLLHHVGDAPRNLHDWIALLDFSSLPNRSTKVKVGNDLALTYVRGEDECCNYVLRR